MTDPHHPYEQSVPDPDHPHQPPQYPGQNYPGQNYPAQNYPAQNYPAQQPFQPPQFQGQPYPALPPQPAPEKPSWFSEHYKQLLVLVVVVVVVASAWITLSDDAKNAAIGDCFELSGSNDYTLEATAMLCSNPVAAYRVTETGADPSCDDVEDEFYGSKGENSDHKLCLTLNAVVGDCFDLPDDAPATKVDCTDPGNPAQTYKVTLVKSNTTDETLCNDDSYGLKNVTRRTLICLDPFD